MDLQKAVHSAADRGRRAVAAARRRRVPILRALAVVALAVGVLFALVGDGVPNARVPGPRGFVLDHFHYLAWFAFALAFALAGSANRGRRRLAGPAALVGLAMYVLFQVALYGAF